MARFRQRKNEKKISAAVLALVLAVSAVPFAVSADEPAEGGMPAGEILTEEAADDSFAESIVCGQILPGDPPVGDMSAAMPYAMEDAAQEGYVDGTDNAVSWSYDPETKTVIVTGRGTRIAEDFYSLSCFPAGTEHMTFVDCELEGSLACLFARLTNLQSIDFTGLTVKNITSMAYLFCGCSSLTGLDLNQFDTENVSNMAYLFCGCSSLAGLELSRFNTGNVVDMSGMFSGCSGLNALDLGGFDTGNVADMEGMFHNCSSLEGLDLGHFTTENIDAMGHMFCGCNGLTALDLEGLHTGNVSGMEYMFFNCRELGNLDLSSFDTGNVADMAAMLYGCSALETLNTPYSMGSVAADLPDVYSDSTGRQTRQMEAAFASTVLRKGAAGTHVTSSEYEEIRNALQAEQVKSIDYILPEGQEVPAEVQGEIFAQLQNSDKALAFVFQETSGREVYRWEFHGDEIRDPGRAVDFRIAVDVNNENVLAIVPDDVREVDLQFYNEGAFPGRSNIRISINQDLETDHLYLYYYNPDTGALELIDDNVAYNGDYASLYLDHSSNYVLTAMMLRNLLPQKPQDTPAPPPAEPDQPAEDEDNDDSDEEDFVPESAEEVVADAVLRHTVVRGETLSGIARMYQTRISQLLSLNPQITNPNRIYVGQILMVDDNRGAADIAGRNSAEGEYYTIQKGDSLYKIADMHKTLLNILLQLNPDLSAQKYIFPGQKVRLK